ncbi:hypothetical protein [Chitinophaga defluvii]|uniref:O-antigen/teichoic acid export membrane protein n=1 Tax=Chitinophaga defluvii TaxID=3163343 RepID=A0ABV2T0M7_9BACT
MYLEKYWNIILKNNFVKSFLILISGSAAAQIINFGFYPLLSRIYDSKDFGVLALFTSIIGICSSFTSGKYELAIPTVKEEAEARKIVKVAMFFSVSFAILVALILFLIWSFFPNFQRELFQNNLVWLVPISIILINGYEIFTYYYIRYGNLKIILRTKLYQAASKNIIQVGGGVLFLNKGMFLVLGLIMSQSTGLYSFVKKYFKGRKIRPFFERDSFRFQKAEIFKYAQLYKKYPLFLIPSGFLNKLGIELPVFFFTLYFGASFTGNYAMANLVTLTPISIIIQSLSKSYLNEFSVKYSTSGEKALSFYNAFHLKLLKWTLLPCILLCFVIKPLALFALGAKWLLAAEMMQYLCALAYFQLIYSTISQTLNVINRHEKQLTWNIIRTVFILALFFIAHLIGMDNLLIFKIYILAMIVFYIILGQITINTLKNHIKHG